MLAYSTQASIFGVVVSALTVFPFVYQAEVLNNVSPVVADFIRETHENWTDADIKQVYSLLCGSLYLGDLFSTLLSGFLVDRLGRRVVLFGFAGGAQMIGCCLNLLARPLALYQLIAAGQFMCGLGNAIVGTCGVIYLFEFATPDVVGRLNAIYALLGILGNATAQVLGLQYVLGTHRLWPTVFCIPLVLSTCCLVASTVLPESPMFLLKVRRNRERAMASFCQVFRSADRKSVEAMFDTRLAASEATGTGALVSMLSIVTVPSYRRSLVTTLALSFLAIAYGVMGFQVFSTQVFVSFHLPKVVAQFLTIGMVAGNVAVLLLALYIFPRFNNRPLLAAVCFICTLCLVALAVAPRYVLMNAYIAQTVAVTAFILLSSVYKLVLFLVLALMARVNPVHIRGRCVSIGRSLFSLSAAAIQLAFLPAYNVIECSVFVVFVVLPLLPAVYLWLHLPETQGRTDTEIAEYWEQGGVVYAGTTKTAGRPYTILVDDNIE